MVPCPSGLRGAPRKRMSSALLGSNPRGIELLFCVIGKVEATFVVSFWRFYKLNRISLVRKSMFFCPTAQCACGCGEKSSFVFFKQVAWI